MHPDKSLIETAGRSLLIVVRVQAFTTFMLGGNTGI